METFLCPACHALIPAARREAHETQWCPALPDSDEDERIREREDKARSSRVGGARASLSAVCQDSVVACFGSRPDVVFELEQQDIFGPLDTGAALWYADRVMSEFLFVENKTPESPGLALVLGSGGVPLSGLVASALGWEVVLTDLEPVLELTRSNVSKNLAVLESVRAQSGFESPPSISVQELYFGDDDALSVALSASDATAAGEDVASSRPLVILCSDCIWRDFLHAPLLETIVAALSCSDYAGRAEAFLSFQKRSPQNEALFMKCVRDDFPFLELSAVDLTETLKNVQWPAQVAARVKDFDMARDFELYRACLSEDAPRVRARNRSCEPSSGAKTPWWL